MSSIKRDALPGRFGSEGDDLVGDSASDARLFHRSARIFSAGPRATPLKELS